MMTQATQHLFSVGESPSSSDTSTRNPTEEQTDDFAALLAASWFTSLTPETPPTSPLTPPLTTVVSEGEAEDSSEDLSDQQVAAPLILLPLLAAAPPPLPSKESPLGATVETGTLGTVVDNVHHAAGLEAIAAQAEKTPINLPSRLIPPPTDESSNPAISFANKSTKAAISTDGLAKAAISFDTLSLPQNEPQPLSSVIPVKEIGRKQESVAADWVWDVPSTETDGAVTLRAEAARRDSVSIVSLLAEATRNTRPPLTASSLKPLLAGLTSNDASPFGDAPASDAISQSDASHFPLHAASSKLEGFTPRAEAAYVPINEQLTGPMTAAAESLAYREGRTLRLRLNPEELGQIEIRLTRDAEGRLSAQLIAKHETTRDVLIDGMSHLRVALERAGLTVDRLDVGVGSGWENSSTGGHATEDDRPHAAAPVDKASEANSSTNPLTTGDTRPAQDRLLNLRA